MSQTSRTDVSKDADKPRIILVSDTAYYVQLLVQPFVRIWTPVLYCITFIAALGSYTLLLGLSSSESKDRDLRPEHDESVQDDTRSRSRKLRDVITFPFKTFVFAPNAAWIPLISSAFALLQLFYSLEKHIIASKDDSAFDTMCPEDGRRTPAGAFVKLLAATVTTIGIHGHLGSLAGSGSPQQELYRAIEIIINPLTPVFSFSIMIWFQMAQLSPYWRPANWSVHGSRLKLARLCHVRVLGEKSDPDSAVPEPLVVRVTSQHLKPINMSRDLKWAGRMFFLVVLLAQYAQAALIISRRISLGRAATVDTVILMLVISGMTGLVQSLIISCIHQKWTIVPDLEPCTNQACSLQACVAHKSASNLSSIGVFAPFGLDLTRVLRQSLYMATAGFVHLQFVLHLKSHIMSLKDLMLTVIGFHFTVHVMVYVLIAAESVQKMLSKEEPADQDPEETSMPANSDNINSSETASTLPIPVTTPSSMDTSTSRITYPSFLQTVMFLVGLAAIIIFLFFIVLQVWYCIAPFFISLIAMTYEIQTWKTWDHATPCPQLWKDGLEDELWWF